MSEQNQARVIRRAEVINLVGLSNTTIHNRIQDGLFPPPFSLGGNSVGWLNTEIARIQSLIVAGKSKDEIKQEVQLILEQRQLVA